MQLVDVAIPDIEVGNGSDTAHATAVGELPYNPVVGTLGSAVAVANVARNPEVILLETLIHQKLATI